MLNSALILAFFMVAPAVHASDTTSCADYKSDLVNYKEIHRHNSMLIRKIDQSSEKYTVESKKLVGVKAKIKELKPIVKACTGRQ